MSEESPRLVGLGKREGQQLMTSAPPSPRAAARGAVFASELSPFAPFFSSRPAVVDDSALRHHSAMRLPTPALPTTYDAATIAAHFDTVEGSAALRERAIFIASTAARALVPGSSIRASVEDLGPSVIKFGQALANRPDLVGRSIADDLRLLQDSCTPFSEEVARGIIRDDLPEDVADEVLAALPATPAAAASLGQVYRLSLPSRRTDEPIALKLLRPGARETVAIMGAHTIGRLHIQISAHRYVWKARSAELLNNGA